MTLGELLDRLYSRLGDSKDSPRFFPRADLLSHANRGCLFFRSLAHEVWRRTDISTVAMQGEYTKPKEILEIRRLAWNDRTLNPITLNVLQSRDPRWKENYGPEPVAWTTLGFAHDKFFIWPKPTTGATADTVTFDNDFGGLVRFLGPDGNAVIFTADDYGGVIRIDGFDIQNDYGDLASFEASELELLTLWGDDRPAQLVADGDEIPIRRAYQIAIFFFVLWQVYEGEGDNHNPVLGAHYRDRFGDQVERCRKRAANPVPSQVVALRGEPTAIAGPAGESHYGDVIIGGVPIPTIWPPWR